MHELPITKGILDIVLEHANDQRVSDVHLVVGELAGAVDDCVQFYWDILSEGTPAAGARLHFRRIPLEFACGDCGATFTPAQEDYTCPGCHGANVGVAAGDDLRVEAIDIETGAERGTD